MKDIKKYLGIDWGERRIGLAVGDNQSRVATPFRTVAGLEEILTLAQEEDIDILIVGRPVKMSGEDKKLNSEFLKFSEDLQKKSICPVEFVDERLSSKAGDRLVGSKKTKASRDEIAATIILQDYLDSV